MFLLWKIVITANVLLVGLLKEWGEICFLNLIISQSKTCPRCRDPATLNDIKQLFVEEAGDSSDDSGDELIQSSSNLSTKNENVNY